MTISAVTRRSAIGNLGTFAFLGAVGRALERFLLDRLGPSAVLFNLLAGRRPAGMPKPYSQDLRDRVIDAVRRAR